MIQANLVSRCSFNKPALSVTYEVAPPPTHTHVLAPFFLYKRRIAVLSLLIMYPLIMTRTAHTETLMFINVRRQHTCGKAEVSHVGHVRCAAAFLKEKLLTWMLDSDASRTADKVYSAVFVCLYFTFRWLSWCLQLIHQRIILHGGC